MLGLAFLFSINSVALAGNYTVKPGDTLFLIGQRVGLTAEQLQSANNLKGTWILPGQVLNIPSYTVRYGDSLFCIGQKFELTTEQLQFANDMEGSLIYPGQVLNLPSRNSYVVRHGDTLFSIAQKFGVTVEQLQTVNGLEETWIFPRQLLNIPSYTVRSGDTLYLIANSNGITWQQLMNHNQLQSTIIVPGQTLVIPANNSVAAPATPAASPVTTNHNFTQEELNLLARTVYSEARGEPFEGQVAVAAVVLNRLNDPDFPNTVREVIFQPLAFTAVADGQFWLTPNQRAYDAVHYAINGWDPVDGALYYWNPVTATSRWIWTRDITHRIGQHVFGI